MRMLELAKKQRDEDIKRARENQRPNASLKGGEGMKNPITLEKGKDMFGKPKTWGKLIFVFIPQQWKTMLGKIFFHEIFSRNMKVRF